MKQKLKMIMLLPLITLLAFTSCKKDEVTKLTVDTRSFALNTGENDDLKVTIIFTGDVNEHPLTWNLSNKDIVNIAVSTESTSSKSSTSTLVKKISINALKEGTTILTLSAGEKTATCEISVSDKDIEFTAVQTSNYGDFYDIGNNSFDIYLMENTLSLDDSGKFAGNGIALYLDFIVPITQSGMTDAIFTMSEKGDVNTFLPGTTFEVEGETYANRSRLETYTDTEVSISLIKEGLFEVKSISSTTFTVEGDLTTEDNLIFHFSYTGTMPVTDKREVPVVITPNFTQGELLYFGDAYATQTNNPSNPSNNFVVYLATENVDFKKTNNEGEILMLELNTSIEVKDSIPSGTYAMITELVNEQLNPYTLVFGYNDEGYDFGCWYYSTTTTKNLKTGNVVVTKTGDQYKMIYTLTDRFGSEVKGEYNGPLAYTDGTKSTSSSVSMSKAKSKNGIHKAKTKVHTKINKIKASRIKR